MSTTDKDEFDIADLSSNLPAAAAALSAEDRDNLVNALKDKLHTLAGKHSDVMENLSPKVKERVEVLRELQGQYDELESNFFEERAALEAKYDDLYEPLYTKRYEIVNAVVEVDRVTETSENNECDKEGDEKGVPYFWLNALKNNEIVGEEILKRDEEALKYLKDIKCTRVANPKSFTIRFLFDTNPFFKNSVLTKTYIMLDDNEPILEKSIGTHIEWHPGKCLTTKVLKKKPKKGSSKKVKPITKVEKVESFFNFFNPPQVPEDEDELDIDDADELQYMLERDYDVGATIRDKIVPHAVTWFTGEAIEGDDDLDDSNNEDREDEEEDEKAK